MKCALNSYAAILATMMLLITAGCGSQSAPPSSGTAPVMTTGADHSGWWCAEHGIPEAECAQCDSKLAAEFQQKKDWCKEHNRPESQCFKCHPELEAKFAARYEAKYGKKPPARTE